MSKVLSVLQGWPVPVAAFLIGAMILGSTVDEIDMPDWLADTFATRWVRPEPDAPPDAPAPRLPVPFAPAPGRDDRTPIAFLNHVFELGSPSLPSHLGGIGPVFWDHAGQGTGALISPTRVLTTGHLFAKAGEWEGPFGRTPKAPAPSDGRIYLEACGRAYDFAKIDLGSMTPRERLGLDYAIAELAEPACDAAHVLPVAVTPDDLASAADQMVLNFGAYRFADVDWYAHHPLFAGRDLDTKYARFAVFGVSCSVTGREDTGEVAEGSTAVIVTQGCDGVPGGSGGPLLVSRDGGASYAIVGVANSYRRTDREFNNYTRIEGAVAAHLSGYVDLVALPPASTTSPSPASLPEGPNGAWLPMRSHSEDLQ